MFEVLTEYLFRIPLYTILLTNERDYSAPLIGLGLISSPLFSIGLRFDWTSVYGNSITI